MLVICVQSPKDNRADTQFRNQNETRPVRIDRTTFIHEVSNGLLATQNNYGLSQKMHVYNMTWRTVKRLGEDEEVTDNKPNLAAHF